MTNPARARRQGAFLVGLQTAPPADGHGAAPADGRGAPLTGAAPEAAEWDVEQSLNELARLADSAGLRVVGRTWQRRAQPHPRTYVGGGKLEEVAAAALDAGAGVVLFDDELTPSQLRSVENALGDELPAVDRTALILDIFARHARSGEGQLQVELAQLEYRLPRLTRLWTHLARQAGGRAGMGVGLRGPGETQIEVDRRRVRQRLSVLRTRIRSLSQQRQRGRLRRERSGNQVLALVGYTNAGKSTLLNRLTGAGVLAADQLFATLDPTTRRVDLGAGRRALLTDTVGFIHKLPHQLVAAFRATLEEVAGADLLLVVADASDPAHRLQQQAVAEVLEEIGAAEIPRLSVLNKVDLVAPDSPLRLRLDDSVPVSAATGEGIDDLRAALRLRLSAGHVHVELEVPYAESRLLGLLRAGGRIERQVAAADGYRVSAVVPPRLAATLRDALAGSGR